MRDIVPVSHRMSNIIGGALLLRAASAILVLGTAAWGQWVEQSIQLEAGWNGIYLEVDPVPGEADLLLSGRPVEAVWSPAEDLVGDNPPECRDPNDPQCEPAFDSDWRVWLPASHPGSCANTLRVMRGGRAYLVKASAPTALSIKGRPNGARTRWRGGFNLAGFHVVEDSQAAPSFAAYLAPSVAHSGAQIYEITANGAYARIADASQRRISAGKGYWVKSAATTEYDGPISVDAVSLRGLDFGLKSDERPVVVENLAASQRTLTLRVRPSAGPPTQAGTLPSVAGDVPVAWLEYLGATRGSDAFYQWHPLQAASWQLAADGAPGSVRTITMSVRRAGLGEAVVEPDGSGAQYQGVIEVTDNAGSKRLVSLMAQVGSRAGLWIGRVVVDRVSWVTAPLSGDGDATTPRPTPAAFSFPIIVHRNSIGECKLLTEVTMMWQPNAGDPESGRYVLVTPDAPPGLLNELEPGSQRDGEPFSRRASTAAFSFDHDLPLTGDLSSALHGETVVPADHRLNPFKHKYHPDHDCDPDVECYEIVRRFSLTFDIDPPPGTRRAGWGDTMLGGGYTEQVEGLHRETIHSAGRFELRRSSHVATLNAQ